MHPAENSLDLIVEEFFNKLIIQNQYYSNQSKQPILLIGEKDLYKAIKEAVERVNNSNSNTKIKIIDTLKTTEIKQQFKPLPSTNFKFLL